ncbi:MAG TPA: UDP-N-acetylmuramate dehydrogenase [Thermodesulfovibrionales bacterium]|nr:UDP-N-acetylmuramate dehydrogenase [Thermodesulfovibrionales bacterium]
MTEERNSLREMLRQERFRGDVLFDEPMKNHTTLRIGGNAQAMVTPQDVISLRNLLMEGRERNIPVVVVGGCSNLLVTDGGIEGIVVSAASLCRILVIEEKDDEVRLFVESGTPLQKMVNLSKEKGYEGLEGLAGIPGSVGGAVRGNSGSFGYEIGNVIDAVSVMNQYGKLSLLDARNLTFRYRSIDIPDECMILSVNMRLKKGDAHGVAKSINDFLLEKRTKQPIGAWSAGCVFKNPEGAYAGKLIDEAGCKGMRRGDVEVSGLHANFFINRGEGRASDFLALMDEVRERVMKAFGIELEREIKIVGRDRDHAD